MNVELSAEQMQTVASAIRQHVTKERQVMAIEDRLARLESLQDQLDVLDLIASEKVTLNMAVLRDAVGKARAAADAMYEVAHADFFDKRDLRTRLHIASA